MGFASQIVLVRVMGLAEWGAMQVVIAAFDLVAIFFDLNLYYSAIRYGGEALGRGDRDKYERVFSAVLQIKIALSGFLILISIGAWSLGFSYKGQRLGISFLILAFNYLFMALFGYAVTIFNTDKRFGMVSLQNASSSIITASSMIVAALMSGTMVSVLFGQAIGSLTISCLVLILIRDRIYFRRITRALLKEVSVYAAQWAVSSIMKRILGKMSVLIVGIYITPKAAGLYRIAQSIASPINTAVGPLWNVLFPIVSETAGKEDYGKLMTLVHRGGRLLTVGAIPLAAVASFLVAPFLHIVYKIDSPEAVSTAVLLLWVSALSVTSTIFPPILRVFRNDIATWYSVVATALNVGLAFLLVRPLGIRGCAMATLITYASGFVFMYAYLHGFLARRTKVRYDARYFLLYIPATLLLVTGYLNEHLMTAIGTAALIGVVFIFRMISLRELKEFLPNFKFGRTVKPESIS